MGAHQTFVLPEHKRQKRLGRGLVLFLEAGVPFRYSSPKVCKPFNTKYIKKEYKKHTDQKEKIDNKTRQDVKGWLFTCVGIEDGIGVITQSEQKFEVKTKLSATESEASI